MLLDNLKLQSIGVSPMPGSDMVTVDISFEGFDGRKITVLADLTPKECSDLNTLFRSFQGDPMFQLKLEKAVA